MAGSDENSLRARKKQEARARILDASERLIRSRGYAATKMRDIARAADLSYQTLYNYFPTKGQILRTLLTDRVDDLGRRFTGVLERHHGGLLQALDELNAISFDAVAGTGRELWRIATVELFQHPDDAGGAYRLIDQMAHEVLERLLVEARNRGELSASVPLLTLGDVLFDLADHALLKFILDTEPTTATALETLGTEVRLVLSPHLTGQSWDG